MVKSKSKKQAKEGKKQSDAPTLTKKELAAQKRKVEKERQEFISFTSATFFASVFLGILVFPVGGPKATGGVIGGILCFALSYKYPRKALWAFLMYMPFGGTVVYAIAGGNALFQLAKDAFYIPAVIALFQNCQRNRQPFVLPKGLKPTLTIMLVLSLVTLLVVNGAMQFSGQRAGQPIIMGLLGIKALLGYLPLISCAYYLIRSKRELLFLTRTHVILAIVCCVLALVQYQFLRSGRCAGTVGKSGDALFKASLDARCFVGGALLYTPEQGVIRLPGTFVSPWHWAWFLIANAFLTYATAFSDPSPLWRAGGLAGMAIVFVNAVICGQRIALALVPVVTVILLVLTGQFANLKRFLPIATGLGVILAIGMAMFPDLVQERVDSFIGRWNASPPTDFIAAQAKDSSNKAKGGFLGAGLGRATNSARTFGSDALIETYYPKVLFEIGWPGLIAFLLLVTSLTVITFKVYRSVKEQNLRSYGASFWVFVLVISYNTYWYPLDTDPVSVYYWFFAGVILRLPEIEKQEKLLEEPEQKLKKKSLKARKPSSKFTVGSDEESPSEFTVGSDKDS